MRIVLCGGGGFIGSALAPELVQRGHDVTVLDLFWFGRAMPSDVTDVKQELFDCCGDDFENADVVVFLAGLSNDPMAEFSPALNFKYNAALPALLAFLARGIGVRRFVYASSCSVYGWAPDEEQTESGTIDCDYPYGIAKLQGEAGVSRMLCDGEFEVVALRKGTVCGHSPRPRADLIVNAMIKSALTEGVIYINDATTWRPLLSVRDAVRAYVRAIEGRASGVFNVASVNATVREVADDVLATLCLFKYGAGVEIVHRMRKDRRSYRVSTASFRAVFGNCFSDGVRDMAASVLQNLEAYGDFSDPALSNIETFKALGENLS